MSISEITVHSIIARKFDNQSEIVAVDRPITACRPLFRGRDLRSKLQNLNPPLPNAGSPIRLTARSAWWYRLELEARNLHRLLSSRWNPMHKPEVDMEAFATAGCMPWNEIFKPPGLPTVDRAIKGVDCSCHDHPQKDTCGHS
jgi:hypothetical protein